MQALIDQFAADPEKGGFILFMGGLFIFGAIRFLKLQARRRWMEDMPTSRIRSASQGYVELEGRARLMEGLPIYSPLTQTECTWYRFKVEKRDQDRDNHTRWTVMRKGVSSQLFLLQDNTGECVVDPDDALVEAVNKRVWYGPSAHPVMLAHAAKWTGLNDYRYTEELILPAEQLYALGWFTSHDPLHISPHERVRDTVIAWKNDPLIKRRFDADGNGHLDEKEFAALREEARQHAMATHHEMASAAQTHVLKADPEGRPFLLSTHDQHQLASRMRIHAWLWLAGALMALGVMLHLFNGMRPLGSTAL